jgi:transposase
MQDTELYRQLLGVQAPWFVCNVELDIEAQAVRVYLDFHGPQAAFCCPECGQYANLYDRRETRQWRHLDSCQFQTFLVASLPRVSCKAHGILTPAVFWCEPNSRFTALFERFALDVLLATQVQAKAAKLLRLSGEQMAYLMGKAVARGLQRRDPTEAVAHVGVDEKAFAQGHQYATLLTDLDKGRGMDLVQHRTQDAATTLLDTALSPAQKASVQSVSMDLWPAFANAQEQVLPHADKVHDRFHIAGYLGEAVDATRKDEHRQLSRHEDKTLVNTKYLWLRSEQMLSDKQRQALAALTGLELQTAQAWAFKECFRQFFACESEYGARTFFLHWHEAAQAVGNKHLSKVADMLHKHLDGLLAYIRHRVTNAVAENLNGQIQRVKSNARGFRHFDNFRVAVLFFLGKLDLYPHTLR